MATQPRAILLRLGLDEGLVDLLLETPGFDAGVPAGADEASILLRAAVAAAGRPAWLRDALERLVGAVEARGEGLGDLQLGVLRHLQALCRWRIRADVPDATRHLLDSLTALEASTDRRAAGYAGRVHDTLGQLLQRQGQLGEAREAFERALVHKEAAGDAEGTALTLGNLGRLCMELGDFEAAANHLARDLAWVESLRSASGPVLHQLQTQLAWCRARGGDLEAGRAQLMHAHDEARRAGDAVATAFAGVHLGRLALLADDTSEALSRAREVEALLAGHEGEPWDSLRALHAQLVGEAQLTTGDLETALSTFAEAESHFDLAARASPIDRAELLEARARALIAAERPGEAALQLRKALRALDGTSADALRARLDDRLRALDESAWMLHSSGRFVGHAQIELLLDEGGRDGFRGREEDVTVLFSDLRGFTKLSQGMRPDALVDLLNRYLTHMTRCVEHFGGMVDKFIGDAVMAVFSLPHPRDDDADRAVAAARYMGIELERFNRARGPRAAALRAGIGLHHGRVVAGLIGSPRKRAYTVIGDVVNTASRIEGLTKHLGVPLLVSGPTVSRMQAPERWVMVPFGRYAPKGSGRPVEVFHPAALADGSAATRAASERARRAEAAFETWQARDFGAARAAFDELRETTDSTTGASGFARLAGEAARLVEDPAGVDGDWDGTIRMAEK